MQTITQGAGDVVVYLDATRMGGPAALRQIPTSAIASIRYYDPSGAVQKWGVDHGFGAIVVSTH